MDCLVSLGDINVHLGLSHTADYCGSKVLWVYLADHCVPLALKFFRPPEGLVVRPVGASLSGAGVEGVRS